MRVKERIKDLGHCVELISMDPYFEDITLGLFIKSKKLTVWSYSQAEGINFRINQVRDRVAKLGEFEIDPDSSSQVLLDDEFVPEQVLRFLFKEAVMKNPSLPVPTGEITAKDNKSSLTFIVDGNRTNEGFIYVVKSTGSAERRDARIRAVVGGFIRYGECNRVEMDKFQFSDGKRHDGFVRLLLPYARNVSAVENLLANEEMAGQMTTQTLGFSQN